MEKKFLLEGIDCGVCGAKIEKRVSKLKGVKSASFNLISEKLIVELDGEVSEELFSQIEKECKKVEGSCKLSDY